MAGRDYILCDKCGVKVIYDGDKRIRKQLEDRWGYPNRPTWTVKLLCPGCIRELQAEIEQLRHTLEN